MNNMTAVFIALTGLAVALQAGVLLAMYFAMRKSSEQVEALATDVKTKLMPMVERAQTLIGVLEPKVVVIAENLAVSTTTLREQVRRVDATVNDVVDRARLQIIRADELMGRTLDRVEETSDLVHKTVVSPVRQLAGLLQGITVGLEFLFAGARRNGGRRSERQAVPQDEMFI